MAEGGLLYKDVVPYDAPASLASLRGPATGVVELPVTVHWGPQRGWDVSVPGQAVFAYQQLVREGTPEVQEALLDAGLLRSLWPRLILPERCRALWEARFPELAAA